MIAFEVTRNRKRLALAGQDDLSVLNVIVDAVGKLGSKSHGARGKRSNANLYLHIGGLTSRSKKEQDEFVDWVSHLSLKRGDEIHIRILDADVTDRPTKSRLVGEQSSGIPEREMFENCKRVYFRLREKYEKGNG